MAGDNSSSHAEGCSTDSGHGDPAPAVARPRRASIPVPALASDIRLTVPARPENVARPAGGAPEVIVADAGRDLGPSPDTAGPGLGLPLIAALADLLEIDRDGGAGSRLTISFLRTRTATAMEPA